jgi:hypothetical protein
MLLPFDFAVLCYADAEKLVKLIENQYDSEYGFRDFEQMKADDVHEIYQSLRAFVRLKWEYERTVDNASSNQRIG